MGFYLKLDTCCCGCSLRSGTLILLWLGLGISILDVLKGYLFLTDIILLTVMISGLFAVFAKKPALLLPYVILGTVVMTISLLGLLMLIFTLVLAIFAFDYVHHQLEHSYNASQWGYSYNASQWGDSQSTEHSPDHKLDFPLIPVIILVCCVQLILVLLQWYFISVVYSYYNELQEEINNSESPY